LIRRQLEHAAAEAPAPRFTAIGVIKGAPPDVSENVDRYLAETGFGEY
jgi:hypothetical protein